MEKYQQPWHISDRAWFNAHPERFYRVRNAIPKEPAVHGVELFPEGMRVIVRRLSKTEEIYSGIAFIYPLLVCDDESTLKNLYQRFKQVSNSCRI